MRNRFDRQLLELNNELIQMGSLIEQAIEMGISALVKQDVEKAEQAIKFDVEVDEQEKTIEALCMKLLLQQQPVAKDLRLISAALKMITDMERIGDHAADISEMTILMADSDYEKSAINMEVIKEMTRQVKEGKNYVIFPEGTRSRKGNELLEFKAGTFKSAINAGCPIVPVALINSFRPFDISSIKKEQVEVHYLEPIYKEQYIGLKTREIADLVHDRIQAEIDRCIKVAK